MSYAVCQNDIPNLKSSLYQLASACFSSRMQSAATSVIHRKLPLGLNILFGYSWALTSEDEISEQNSFNIIFAHAALSLLKGLPSAATN